jgi:integrase
MSFQTKKKSEKAQTPQLLWWKAQLGPYLLSDITPSMIVEQRDSLLRGTTKKGTERSPATVVRYLAALSHAFTICINEWGWLEDSPMKKVKKPRESRGRVRYLNDDERKRLLNACLVHIINFFTRINRHLVRRIVILLFCMRFG